MYLLMVKFINKFKIKIINLTSRIYSLYLSIYINKVGKQFFCSFPVRIIDGHNINIGNNFSAMGYDYLYGNEGIINIGSNVSINTNVILSSAGGKITIGNDVLIGPNVIIRTSNHKIKKNKLIRDQGHNCGNIIIENDVWIAANACILSNVKLGKGCVVAAGSVVRESFSEYSIIGGVPAKLIGTRK